jgi:hypothetical protein
MKKIKKVVLLLATVAAVAAPAVPAHATTCAAADPTVDYVLCDVVYPPVASAACRVKLLCY